MKKINSRFIHIIITLLCSCSFLAANSIITTNQALFSEWWIVDRLMCARITFFFCSLIVVFKKSLITYRYLIGILVVIAISLGVALWNFSIFNGVLTALRGLWCMFLYKNQQNRIARKRRRTWMLYAFSSLSQKAILVAIITSIALITSLEKTGIQCDSFISLWRFDYLNKYITVWSIGSQTWTNWVTWENNDLLWLWKQIIVIWSTALKDILSLLNEQKYILQNQTCAYINTQIEQLKSRPQWKFAWIFLLYLFLRPVFSVVFWIGSWIQRCIRQILIHYAIIKKTTHQDIIISFSL